MKQINFSKHILPHLIAVGIFLLIVFIFYKPLFLDNKEIYQNDIQQGLGASAEAIEYRKKNG